LVVTGLVDVLERSRGLGFLGPGSVRVHIDHANGLASGVEQTPRRFLDLGSGGGVPGLVLSMRWVDSEAVLLDARERRCLFLQEAVRSLGLAERVSVVCERAEDAGHREDLRAYFDVVVARSFGRPATTAECGAPFLRVGGTLAVSEPPADGDGSDAADSRPVRWAPAGLAQLGLVLGRSWAQEYRYQALEQVELCPAQYPRRSGLPAKRPLF
jgi:16S rRNA (guanine527-N7)-methyltransferase